MALVYVFCLHSGVLEIQKIRYVRSADLLYGYEGMKEAQANFGQRDAERRSRVDTLKKDLQEGYQAYMQKLPQLRTEEKSQWEDRLNTQQGNLVRFAGMVEENSRKDEEEVLGEVLQQVNDFVHDYAVSHGFDMVYGTTAEGNVLYGDPSLDITDPILEALNRHYRGQ